MLPVVESLADPIPTRSLSHRDPSQTHVVSWLVYIITLFASVKGNSGFKSASGARQQLRIQVLCITRQKARTHSVSIRQIQEVGQHPTCSANPASEQSAT